MSVSSPSLVEFEQWAGASQTLFVHELLAQSALPLHA